MPLVGMVLPVLGMLVGISTPLRPSGSGPCTRWHRTAPVHAMSADEAPAPPEKLLALLMQCAVQAQLYYFNEFKNEIMGRWLESFLGHEHLNVKRVSDKGGGIIQFRGLSDGLRCSPRDYMITMLQQKPEEYKVRYKIGTADGAGVPTMPTPGSEATSEGSMAGADAPWAAASASRAANPYLKKAAQYREYTEVVEPRRVARGLQSISVQLAGEWTDDLAYVATEGALLLDACAAGARDECELPGERLDEASSGLLRPGVNASTLATDTATELPPALSASFRAASMSWVADFAEMATPFRSENFDLLERACTREAAIAAIATLDRGEGAQTASERAEALVERRSADCNAEWLRGRLLEWLPRFEAPRRTRLAGLFLLELIQAAPTPQRLVGPEGDERFAINDPTRVATEVIMHRQRIAREWADELKQTSTVYARWMMEDLEGNLGAAVEPQQDE
jgi:hypothetical protein